MPACKSCGASIRWINLVRPGPTPLGKHPIDATPADDGNIVEVPIGGTLDGTPNGPTSKYVGTFRILRKDEHRGTGPFYRSHFSTCPNAAQHRKPKEPSGG